MDNNILDKSLDRDNIKKRVLVLCTGNSIRSQMAEGFLKKYRESWHIESAGTFPVGINPMAVAVMAESGIDISKNSSKSVSRFISSSLKLTSLRFPIGVPHTKRIPFFSSFIDLFSTTCPFKDHQ